MLEKMTEEQWDDVLRVNLKSMFLAIQAAAEPMKAHGGGSIICMSSMGALRGTIGQVNYAAAKAGVIGLVRAAAKELARYQVRVNAIAPGTVDTPMTEKVLTDGRFRDRYVAEIPMGRVGQPSDIGNTVRFLAGAGSSWMTGQVVSVNGGTYI
jgi:3-oxoacyl-[acyl-carrier protein] reductase